MDNMSLSMSPDADWFAVQRRQMIRTIERQGLEDARVTEAMLAVPREAFVPNDLQEHAYDDSALPIGQEQTISQPYIVALMASLLDLLPTDRVLEVGTGSGYAAAVLSKLAAEVFTIERLPELAQRARQQLNRLGIENIHVQSGDGTVGWPEHAPYDAISVAAGGPDVPPGLLKQLSVGGRLVMPVGHDSNKQQLVRVRRTAADAYEREELCSVRFVPLVGEGGWRN